MEEAREAYRRIGDDSDRFDIEFWQSQADRAIFDTAWEMVSDYVTIRHGHADQLRLQRTVESYGRQEWGLTQSHEDTKN